jgi:hypothetical protein
VIVRRVLVCDDLTCFVRVEAISLALRPIAPAEEPGMQMIIKPFRPEWRTS